jgi:hypothetical protein
MLPVRIEQKIRKEPDGCWVWTACIGSTGGYGIVWLNGKNAYAHKVIYEMLIGKVPEGKQLDHLCRVRNCVNPAHLEVVSCRENLLRGDTFVAKNKAKTHCKRGHRFTEHNTKYTKQGWRYCRACDNEQSRAYTRRQK